jgi:hypothetical protein
MALLTMMARCRHSGAVLQRRIGWFVGLILLAVSAPAVAAENAPTAEYQVKAVFLYNFAQFVEWPTAAFRGPDAPLVIGIFGENPFGSYLDDLVKGEKIGGRPLAVRHYQRPEDIKDCHILFISSSETATLDRIITRLRGHSILTVSDTDLFIRRGGMVRFITEDGKIRLRINLEAAKAVHLTISSKILRPEMIVTPEK